MTLLPATADLAAELAHAHAAGFATPWSAAEIAGLFDGPGVYGFLVVEAEPVGMILCRVVLDEAEVLTVAVSPALRRRGLGRMLVAAAMDSARQAGAAAMFLEVAVDNAEAIALYDSLDFRRAGLRRAYYDRGLLGRVDALVMRRNLNAEPTSAYPDVGGARRRP